MRVAQVIETNVSRATRWNVGLIWPYGLAIREEEGDLDLRITLTKVENAHRLVTRHLGLWTGALRRNVALGDGPANGTHGFGRHAARAMQLPCPLAVREREFWNLAKVLDDEAALRRRMSHVATGRDT